MRTRTRHSQKCLRHPLLPPHQTPVYVLLALEQTLLLNHHLLNARTPVWVLLVLEQTLLLSHHLLKAQTPLRVLLALEQTLLRNHQLLNALTPVLFQLAQGQTLVLNRHLLIAVVWTILCLGSIWQTLWHREQPPRVGEPSHPLWVGYSLAYPQYPLPLMWTHLLILCV